MNSVQVKVAETIANIAPKVEDKVVDALVDRELKRRSDALVSAMDKLDKMEKELSKIKADQISFDEDGKVVSQTFSKAKKEEKDKLSQKVQKATNAINKALEKGDFGDVYNIDKAGDNQKSDRDEGRDETDS